MPSLVDLRCPHCGAALPPRGASPVFQCTYCQRSFEVDAAAQPQPYAPLPERTTSADFPALAAEAERLIVEVERAHAALAAKAATLDALALMLQKAATKKLEQRFATTRKAIAERDEATLKDCVERLAMLQSMDAGLAGR
jgi:hypothetical protein